MSEDKNANLIAELRSDAHNMEYEPFVSADVLLRAADALEAAIRSEAVVKAEALRDIAKLARGEDALGVCNVPVDWILEAADSLSPTKSGETDDPR